MVIAMWSSAWHLVNAQYCTKASTILQSNGQTNDVHREKYKTFSCNSQDIYCDCFWFKLPWIKWCPLQKYIRWGKPSKTWGTFPWNSLFWWRSLMHWCWKLCHLLDQLSSSSGCSCASDCQCTNSNAVRGKSYLHQGAYTGGRNVIRGKLFVRFVKF